MTRYEILINKAYKCIDAGKKTEGSIRAIWLSKAYELMEMARALTVTKASEGINE